MEDLNKLSTLEDLRSLGVYSDFDFEKEVKGDFTRIYAVVKLGRSKLFWLVKPIGGMRRIDVDAKSLERVLLVCCTSQGRATKNIALSFSTSL